MGGIGDIMGGIGDMLFGSDAEQVGTAQSPGQAWLQNLLKPMLQQGVGAATGGGALYPIAQYPSAPSVPEYNVAPYSVGTYASPNAPFSSPMDMIQSGELNTARNLMEQFYSGGAGGSARGGLSGKGAEIMGNVLGDLAQGAVGRYAQMQLPYDQMRMQQAQNVWQGGLQQARDVWNMQNQVWGLPLQQANLGYQMGQVPQTQALQQAYSSPWNLASMYSGTYGSPIVQPGQEGLFQSLAPIAGIAGMSMIPGGFGSAIGGMFGI